MDIDEALNFVEQVLLSRQLTPIERLVFCQSWVGLTYYDIAQGSAYGSDYIKEVGSKLWATLSDAVGEKVTKKNVHLVFRKHQRDWTSQITSREQKLPRQVLAVEAVPLCSCPTKLEFPGRPVAIDSALYIPRPPIEELASAEIDQPGCVLCIRAARKMGKSSLVNRLIAKATASGYQIASLDFQEAEVAVFASLDKFLRWFCANVSRQLQLAFAFKDYWDEDLGSKISCKLYFQGYLLEAIDCPLLLTLNEVNRIFEYPDIAQDFLPMLRAWHEQAIESETWKKLRLVVVHTTEVYLRLPINQSLFQVGLPLKLPQFTLEQVQKLALGYGLSWATGQAGLQRLTPLVEMVGGHPYLINLAFYHLCQGELSLEQLLQEAPQSTGIYGEHLRSLLVTLQQEPELRTAFKQIINVGENVPLEAILAYKLESMGLIELEGERAKLSCQLYDLFFRDRLETAPWIEARLEELERENYQLQYLSNVDELTLVANRRYFNYFLKTEWQQQVGTAACLSLILCDVDYLKFYNEFHGYLAGDDCLSKLASTIRNCLSRVKSHVIARYTGDEFAVILPHINAQQAMSIAEEIRASVQALGIAHDNTQVGGFPDPVLTVSLGVATMIPSVNIVPDLLILAAKKALNTSKHSGRNCVTLCPESHCG